jgi:hypothetical protein
MTAATTATATGRAGVTATTATATGRAGMTAATTTWRAGMTAAATTGWTGVTAATGRTGVTAAATATAGRARVPAAVGCDGTGYGEGQRGNHHARPGGGQQATACDHPGTGSAAHRVSFRAADAGWARRIIAMRPEVALEGPLDASNGASCRCFPSTS